MMTPAEPRPEHAWLMQLVGDWTWSHEEPAADGGAPQRVEGTQNFRALGGLWLVGESRSTLPGGGEHQSLITLGFDPVKGRFVGTWLGEMMAHLWVYDGALDAERRALILRCEGPSFSGDGTLQPYEDVIELVGPDHYVLHSRVQNPDGTWHQFLRTDYHRRG